MPLRAIRSGSAAVLWQAFEHGFLGDLGRRAGPDGFPARAWLTHRIQRDRLYRAAATRGIPGWLGPPLHFFSELPKLFHIPQQPLGVLRRRALLAHLAAEQGGGLGITGDAAVDRRGVADALDSFFGDLLAEGVMPDALGHAIGTLTPDAFAERRNAWVAAVYREYLHTLASLDRYDPRAIHALAAKWIATHGLTDPVAGATRLHIYGLWTTRARRRLLQALAQQGEVDVVLYLLDRGATTEWQGLLTKVTDLPTDAAPTPPRVMAAPDDQREMEWVAGQVKRLLLQGVAPHDVAVVARTGRHDTRLAHEVLQAAGVPATARLRSSFAEVPAVAAVLSLVKGAARGWTYTTLRQVLESSYFDTGVDLRVVDQIATMGRVEGLERWQREIARFRDLTAASRERRELARRGVAEEQLTRDAEALASFRETVQVLDAPRSTAEWIRVTCDLLDPGWFGFRAAVCRDAGGHWEIVRLDQQGVEALRALLLEWAAEQGDDAPYGPARWYERVRRFLMANEITLATPSRTGVQLLEAHEAALVPFPHTFVVHANDGEFPRTTRAATLFGDEEREQLAAAGLPIEPRTLGLVRERALWDAVTSGPSVTLTYRTADAEGVPLLPSLLVPLHDEAESIPRTQFHWPAPCSATQAAHTAMQTFAERKRAREPGPVPVSHVVAVQRAILCAYGESQRRGSTNGGTRATGDLGPWSGHLRDPVVLAHLEREFGDDRPWSPSQLERYAQVPFVYLVEDVLGLSGLAEVEEDTSPAAWGTVAHRVLERFYAEYRGPFPGAFGDAEAALLDRVAEEVFAEQEADTRIWLGLPVLWHARKRDIRDKLAAFLQWELASFVGVRPHAFEHRLGYGDDPVLIRWRDLHSVERTIRVRGRIDRIDSDGGTYQVVDYKSKKIPGKPEYADGTSLQGALYAAGLESAEGYVVRRGLFRSIQECKDGPPVEKGTPNYDRLLRVAVTIPQYIRAGRFEPKAAKSSKWPDWLPGVDVVRCAPVYGDQGRFDG